MGLNSWPLAHTSLSLGIGPWVVSGGGASPTSAVGIGRPLNLRPGYVVRTTRNFVSINGTPWRPAGDMPVLNVTGYYEVTIADAIEGQGTVFQICIVDSTTINVGTKAPDSNEPPTFHLMAETLSSAYPSGKISAGSTAVDFFVDVNTSNAVFLEIRKLDTDGTYAKIGEALAKKGGIWRSLPFSLTSDVADIKLAIVFAQQNIVLS